MTSYGLRLRPSWSGPFSTNGSEKKVAAVVVDLLGGPLSVTRYAGIPSVPRTLISEGSGVLHQDAPDLFNHGGMIHTNVEAVYEHSETTPSRCELE